MGSYVVCESGTRHFSTTEIAAAMGVGESSVKRWIDANKLYAEKTPGGHRRVGLSDLYEFLRASGKKLVAPEALGLSRTLASTSSLLQTCQTSLQTGDAFTFESALRALILVESSPAAIIDKTIYPAFQALRATCQHPSEECLVLHRAVSVIQSALRTTMSPKEQVLSDQAPKVVLADIGYEVDSVPTFFAEASVWDQARCLQLGAKVPATVIEGAIDAFQARALWLSASGPCRRNAVNADFKSIVARALQSNVKVVIFGDAAPDMTQAKLTRINRFSEFRAFVAALSH